MQFRVRKGQRKTYEVWVRGNVNEPWTFSLAYDTWWQAMLHVTGDLPYGEETGWTPALRPMWINL